MSSARGSGLTRGAKAKASGHKSPRHETEAQKKKISESLKKYYAAHPRKGHQTAAQRVAQLEATAKRRHLTAKERAELKNDRKKAAAAKIKAAAKLAKQKKAQAARLAKQKAERARQAAIVRANRMARAEHAVAHRSLIEAVKANKTRHGKGETAGRHHFKGRSNSKALVRSHIRRNLKGLVHVHRRRSRAGLLHKTARHHRTHHVWRRRGRRR